MQTAACTNWTFSLKHRVLYTPVFFSANGVQMCSMSMHFGPGSSTSIFVASSILLQAKLILQCTVCLKIWCVGARWTSPLSKFTGRPPRNNLPLATCGCTFSNPGLHIKVAQLGFRRKARCTSDGSRVKPNPKQNKYKLIMFDPTPYFGCQGFFGCFCLSRVTGPYFVIVDGCASDSFPGPSFLPKAMTGCGVFGAELPRVASGGWWSWWDC